MLFINFGGKKKVCILLAIWRVFVLLLAIALEAPKFYFWSIYRESLNFLPEELSKLTWEKALLHLTIALVAFEIIALGLWVYAVILEIFPR